MANISVKLENIIARFRERIGEIETDLIMTKAQLDTALARIEELTAKPEEPQNEE